MTLGPALAAVPKTRAPDFRGARPFSQNMLTNYAKRDWVILAVVGLALLLAALLAGWWWAAAAIALLTLGLLSFYRDPERRTPTQRGVMVAPADGRISSIHPLDHFEPLGGPALCVRIFLSVLNVHVNRAPCHGEVASVDYRPGQHVNALNPRSAEANEAYTIVLLHPIRRRPIAAVRQIAGALARTVICDAKTGQILQRGQRYGMIKLGSTTEVYVPMDLGAQPAVRQGQRVKGGQTVLVTLSAAADVSDGQAPDVP